MPRTGAAKPSNAEKSKKQKSGASSLTQAVFDYLAKHPDSTNQELYDKFPEAPKASIRVHKSTFLTQREEGKTSEKKSTSAKKKASSNKTQKTEKGSANIKSSSSGSEKNQIDKLENKITLLHKKIEAIQNDEINILKQKMDNIESILNDFVEIQSSPNLKSISKTVTSKISSFLTAIKKNGNR